ncbi:MAG: Dihydroxyacetone kinase-like protein, phosphatase domain / Dihydroxyacetone kinase-like protein, kinase domain [uncultured Acidimicrobiales bacterium]|uniref:Dihydroxyacetone kinase-like protein, phosphatase domain / Dihydroxyacetone kinase-like protein, kinase domain n=1 Tax=uncultured Acidimicrobiales bacterium TaxID=310071 RepID=A0A6J4IFT9_9ACTN|nr:MAG: Dihydroxyacetone kinase-like protein, phosphatase domain / Dihydroxyacetone kinase-like protein, kinase domain [uncultured Acidimicrobiales bacterium]
MTTLVRLEAAHLRAVVVAFRDALRLHQEAVNRLNVYPVPDGDTGTNMALTLESVVAELDAAATDMAATCKAISHGSLMGARGNSGVILSQILRGIAGGFADDDGTGVDGTGVAAALTAAAEAAYQAVMRPVEGTILTVVRRSAEAASSCVADGAPSLVDVLDEARSAGQEALDATPEQLPVLKEAGVVDAGGAGLLLLLDAALHVVDGRPIPPPPAAPDGLGELTPSAAHGMAGEGDRSIADLRYEVMYLLEAPDAAVPAFKEVWAGIGDSIVVVGGDGIWNCHIHTDDIGASIEAATDIGRPRRIRVTDLLEQVEEERWVREGAEAVAGETAPGRDVVTAVVAVATGDGIRRIFRSLGVTSIVAGGQSMNPSTAQLLEAVAATGASEVVLLPNNKNIIPVAEQVDALTDVTVRVVPTRGIAEGFAALLSYDPDAPATDNAKEMAGAAEAVLAGEVTRAVRESSCEVGPIAAGDWLGIARSGIVAVEPSLAGATTGLLDALVDESHEMVTIIEGEGSSPADTRRITEWVAEHRPGVEVEVHHGGQPLYPYLLGVE